MFRNFFKITVRNLIRNKGYSSINIIGLGSGLACCLMILLWVTDEISYDGFHERADRIYRVVENQYYDNNELFPVAVTPGPLAETLKKDFPEIENACRMIPSSKQLLFQYGDKRFYEKGTVLADPSFFDVFSFPFLRGDASTALKEPTNVVISERLAQKYFGEENPVGKAFRVENQIEFKVTGVVKNPPDKSHIRFDMIVPFEILKMMGTDLTIWNNNSYFTYVLLKPGASEELINQKIINVIKTNNPESLTEIYLQPLKQIHLFSAFTADLPGHGDIFYVRIFAVIAVIVLLIACINYMNLSTARSANRAKEIGIRKVSGSGRKQLTIQFLCESVFISFFALIVAVILVHILLPVFNDLTGKSIAIGDIDRYYIGGILGITLVTGLVSGIYPALILSSFQPMDVLKNAITAGPRGAWFRKTMVIVQFSLSVILIICTLVISRQLGYIQNKKLGLNKDQVIYFDKKGSLEKSYTSFKNDLLKNPDIRFVSVTSELPDNIQSSSSGYQWIGKNPREDVLLHRLYADYDYQNVLQLEMATGRFFSQDFPSDTSGAVINEAAAKVMGMENPIGRKISSGKKERHIIGVVRDFHFKPLSKTIEPLMITADTRHSDNIVARISPENSATAIKHMEAVWNKYNPQHPFVYHFLDEKFERLYQSETRMNRVFNYFTVLAVLISCIGLFGLASFMIQKRTKEIGIRKVLGASVAGLTFSLCKDFIQWVIIANIIAWPVAYFTMNRWLENYAYRTDIGVMVFILSGLAAIGVALLTVSYQTIKTAQTNPVESLRYE